jgi:hypothetical protein
MLDNTCHTPDQQGLLRHVSGAKVAERATISSTTRNAVALYYPQAFAQAQAVSFHLPGALLERSLRYFL